jgi:hypothetical protein
MVTVKVLWDSSGKPADNQRVVLSFDRGGVTGSAITDRNGEASFTEGPGSGKVIVNGTSRRQCMLNGCVEVRI